MSMRKFVSFVAIVTVAGAIYAAPAGAAGFKVPDVSSLGGVCKSVKQPALQSACNKGVSTIATCSSESSTAGLAVCLSEAAGSFKRSTVKLPFDLKSLLARFTGSTGGSGGFKLPAGLDLSKLLGGLKLG